MEKKITQSRIISENDRLALLKKLSQISYITVIPNTKEIMVPEDKYKYIKSRKFIKHLIEDYGYKFMVQYTLKLL